MAPARTRDKDTGDAGDDSAPPAEAPAPDAGDEAGSMLMTATGAVVPNPAAVGFDEVPYDVGGLPAVRSSADAEAGRTVRVFQDDGEIAISLDGGPRETYQVDKGTITVPARIAARVAAAIPGARLED